MPNFAGENSRSGRGRSRKEGRMTPYNDDKEQFRQMFTRHYARLVRYAVQMTGDADEGRDIVADVMERAWRDFRRIDPDNCGAWLYRCTANACLNRLKHLGVERMRVAEAAAVTAVTDDGAYLEHERLLRRVEAVADALEEPGRSIIRLCYYEHNTHRQAAERLGISPETVKKHIRKALSLLRKHVNEKED